MVQNLKTVIQIGGGVTSGLLNTFNPLRKKLQDTEKGVGRLTRASNNLDRAMRRTTNPAHYSALLRKQTEILEKIKEQRRETLRLSKASAEYTANLAKAGAAFGGILAGITALKGAFGGIFSDFAQFKEVQAETGIEAARLAAITFQGSPLVARLST